MGGVDIMEKTTSAYRLDCKSKYLFYLRMVFDVIDAALVNSHIVYTKLDNDISLLNLKIAVGKVLIGRYSKSKRSFPTSWPCKQKSNEESMPKEVPTHISEFQEKRMRCHYCKNERMKTQTTKLLCSIFVSCKTCGLYLSSTKERKCFLKHHL